MRKQLVNITAAVLLAACGISSGVAGRYKGNFNDIILDLGPQHQVTLTEQGVVYPGRYSVDGDRVMIVLEQPYINGAREQAFRLQESTLVALPTAGSLFLPGGTKFERVQ